MNKVLARLVMGTVVLGAASAQADTDRDQQLLDCREQLATIYGEDVRVRISGRAALDDPALKLLVYPSGERLLRVRCELAADGGVTMEDRFGVALVAPEAHARQVGPL